MSEIAFLTPSAFWYGHPPALHLATSSDVRGRDRRMTRTPTLDGSAVTNDGGWSESDRTFTLNLLRLTEAEAATLEEIAAYNDHRLALPNGLYAGRIKFYNFDGKTNRIAFWVTEKLA